MYWMSLYGANEGISHTQNLNRDIPRLLLGILIGISLFRDIPAFVRDIPCRDIPWDILYRDVLCFVMGHPGTYPMQYPTGCPYTKLIFIVADIPWDIALLRQGYPLFLTGCLHFLHEYPMGYPMGYRLFSFLGVNFFPQLS